jgi:sugar O-acyltransferase (sialic acid O-acetyltransferase NeuD family)
MKNLLIIGAGGFGREVYSWACDMYECNKEWQIIGFLDDDINALDGFDYPTKVISCLKAYKAQPNDIFVCAIGNPKIKQSCVEMLKENGAEQFINIIHPSSIVSKSAKLGKGVILCPMTIVSADANIGDFVTMNSHSNVGHDTRIGEWTQISGYCDITGGVTVGEQVFMGSSVTILPKIKIDSGAIIGAGSVVVKNVGKDITVFGNPAKKISF